MKKVMQSRNPQSRSARRGVFSLELLFTLPILTIVLFALFEFSLLFLAQGTLDDASRAGARSAASPATSREQIERTVRNKLTPRLRRSAQIEIEPGRHTGDTVQVTIRVPMNSASPDLLWPIGISLRDQALVARTRMTKE